MERRPFLALLATTLAGCSATDRGNREPTDRPSTATESALTETPTSTTTATATETPTETATDTPSAEVRRARRLLAETASTLDAVVEQYAGDAGETILAADASYRDFDSRIVVAGIEEARRELQNAREAVVTDEQRRRADALDTMVLFFQAATETQTSLVNAYFHLTEAREALAQRNDSAAERAIVQMDAKRRIASAPYQTIVEETTADAATVLSQFDPNIYRRKREQFAAEMRAFGELRSPLDEFVTVAGRLESARALQRNGSTEQATEIATDTVDRLDRLASSLAAFAEGLDQPADSLVGMGRSLQTLATDLAAETREEFEIADDEKSTATQTE